MIHLIGVYSQGRKRLMHSIILIVQNPEFLDSFNIKSIRYVDPDSIPRKVRIRAIKDKLARALLEDGQLKLSDLVQSGGWFW